MKTAGLASRAGRFGMPIAALAIAVFLIVPSPVHAFLGLETLLADILLGIAEFFGRVTVTLIGILVSIAQYNNFIDAPAVAKGWVIVRDVCNMFFIVILLLIAFGSVFRIEEYQYKKILGKLLIMAVLINFSKSISGFFIDIAQVVMLTFVNGFKEAAAGNFVNGFQIAQMFQFAEKGQGEVSDVSYLTAASLALVTIVISFIVVLVYVVVFILRIVALWFLIIISPIAYALAAFPGDAKKYSSQWWDYFGKYATTGPILAFFLWLSLAVMQFSNSALGDFSAGGINTAKETDGFLTDVPAAAVTGIGQSEVLLSFIINIILLVGGLWMTKQLGVAGGGLAATAMNKIQGAGVKIARAPFKAVAAPVGFAAKRAWGSTKIGWNNMTTRILDVPEGKKVGVLRKTAFAALNPVAAARGWEARTQELEHEAKEITKAYGREVTEQFRTRGKLKVPYATFVERKFEDEYVREYQNMSKEEFMRSAISAEDMKGEEGKRRRRAIVKSAGSQGYLDDLLRTTHFANKYGDKKTGVFYNDAILNKFLYGYLGHDQQSMRLMDTDLDTLGKATGHWEYLGHAGFDPKKGAYERTYKFSKDKDGNEIVENIGQASYARSEFSKVDGRTRARIAPHNELDLVGSQDADGNFIDDGQGQVKGAKWGIGKKGRTAFQKQISHLASDQGTLRDIHFAQGRLKEALISKDISAENGEVIVKSEEDLQKIRTLFEEIPGRLTALFGLLSGVKDAKGFVVRYENDENGEVKKETFGDPTHISEVSEEAAHNLAKDDNLPGQGKEEEKVKSVINIMEQLRQGDIDTIGEVENELSNNKSMALDEASIKSLAEAIGSEFSAQSAELYSSLETAISDKNDKGQFTGKELSDLIGQLKKVLEDAFTSNFLKGEPAGSSKISDEAEKKMKMVIDNFINSREGLSKAYYDDSVKKPVLLSETVIKRIAKAFLPIKSKTHSSVSE